MEVSALSCGKKPKTPIEGISDEKLLFQEESKENSQIIFHRGLRQDTPATVLPGVLISLTDQQKVLY